MDKPVHQHRKDLTMNRLLAATVAVASIAFAGAALADDITIDNTQIVSSKTRAEVRAEYLASRQQTEALTREDSGSAYLAQRQQSEQPAVVAQRPVGAR
jgi:hypothetical protein